MTEFFDSLKYFPFYTIALLFEYKANHSDKYNEYTVKFRYFAKFFHKPHGTYLNWFFEDQELDLIN